MKYYVSAIVDDVKYETLVNVGNDAKPEVLYPKCALALQYHMATEGLLIPKAYVDFSVPKKNGMPGCVWFNRPLIRVIITRYDGKPITM